MHDLLIQLCFKSQPIGQYTVLTLVFSNSRFCSSNFTIWKKRTKKIYRLKKLYPVSENCGTLFLKKKVFFLKYSVSFFNGPQLSELFTHLLITRCRVIMFIFFLHFIPLSVVPRDYQRPPYRMYLIVQVLIPLSVAYRLQLPHCYYLCQTTKTYRRLRADCY